MTWFTDLFSSHEDKNVESNFDNPVFWSPLFGGGLLSEKKLLSIPAAYDAINAIVNPLKTLPLIFFERISEKEKKPLSDNEVAQSLMRPNQMQNRVEFFDFMCRNLMIYYNAFAEILSDRSGKITGYIPFHPDKVSIEKRPTGFVYKVTENARTRIIMPDSMWHIKSGPFDQDGLMGVGPIVTHEKALNSAIAVLDYGQRFFENDAQPGGVLNVAGKINPEAARELSKSWRQSQTGRNRHRTAVLEEGTEYKPFTIENNKAQFIETRKADDINIARIWNVPPHRIKTLDDATYSNIEQQAIEYVVHSLQPWLILMEASIKTSLIGLDNNIFAEFNILGLLRGDIKARYEAYAQGRSWGWLSVNDVRRLERMNPLPDGDIYLQPLNFAEAGTDINKSTNNSGSNSADNQADETELELIKGGKNA